MNWFAMLRLLAEEYGGRDTLVRQPEPSLVMDSATAVEAFDEQGHVGGALTPLYHFSALAISRLLPEGGRLLDLGSGSGRLLAYLAQGRPDVEMVGLELSQPMVDSGNRLFDRAGLFPRVRLEKGDMTRCADHGPGRIHAVSVNLALEHLANGEALRDFLWQVRALVARHQCACWIFNHSRPKTLAAARLFPEAFTPRAPAAFREDSRNSLVASWRFAELLPLLHSHLGQRVQGRLSRWLPYYQAFWLDAPHAVSGVEGRWRGRARPAGAAGLQFVCFRRLFFPDVPLDGCDDRKVEIHHGDHSERRALTNHCKLTIFH